MALASFARVLVPSPIATLSLSSFATGTNYGIDTSGQRYAWVFQVPFTGTITKLGIRIAACATPVTSRLGLYTIDTSGNPTTTLYGGSNYGTFTPAANTYSEVTLGTSASATMSEWVAMVLEFDSSTGNMQVSPSNGTSSAIHFGYLNKFSGTWSKLAFGQMICGHVYYSDGGGTWPFSGMAPFTAATEGGNYNSTTGGADEYAIKMTFPTPDRIVGAWHNFAAGTAADYDIVLYNGTTAERTLSVDGAYVSTTTGFGERHYLFSSGYDVAAGTTLRMAIKPTTTNNVTYRRRTLFSADSVQSLGLPSGTCESKRLDSGSWTDTTTLIPDIGFILDQFDNGAGAGGGGPLIGGRLVR
jgi:hypothetical protein